MKLLRALAVAALALGASACAGRDDRTRTALDALDRGAPQLALTALDEQLGVARPEDAPGPGDDSALGLLDRATVLASLDRFDLSERDLDAADKAIDVLDLSRAGTAELGKYLFSGGASPYRAPGYEKLLLHTIDLVDHLARHDLVGAQIEARRLAAAQRYLRDHDETIGAVGLGSYLAGFAFEEDGHAGDALDSYEDALAYAQYESLRDPLRALTRGVPRSRGIDALVGGKGPLPLTSEAGEAEIVVVIAFGRTPQREALRIPFGLAVDSSASLMSSADVVRANALAARGLVTSVEVPVLRRGRAGYAAPSFFLDGKEQTMDEEIDVESEVLATWHKKAPVILLAAVERTIARFADAERPGVPATAAPSLLDAPDAHWKEGGGFGLPGGAPDATSGAFDLPDTRGWATLPARIAVTRLRVKAGRHTMVLGARGWEKRGAVTLAPGGWTLVPMVVLR